MATRLNRADTLEPPRQSVELQDSGAHDLETSGEDEPFSDALEGRTSNSRPPSPLSSRNVSPVPRTRVQKVDREPAHGEVPGSEAYNQRRQDAVPDELEVVPEGKGSHQGPSDGLEAPMSPSVPLTVVEKVDPDAASHGDIPGTAAYDKRLADASPDLIFRAADANVPRTFSPIEQLPTSVLGSPIPDTVVTRADSLTSEEDQLRAIAKARQAASLPTLGEDSTLAEGSATSNEPLRARAKSSLRDFSQDSGKEAFGDDFDDFEDGAEGDDEFGEFGDDLDRQPSAEDEPQSISDESLISFPILKVDGIGGLSEMIESCQSHLDAIFPNTSTDAVEMLPTQDPIPSTSLIFPSERSRALGDQLVTPPPSQPPNWTKSRIRRLFLVSLGVPVDLDEILPPSKQKKLVLPDMYPEATRTSESDRALGSVSKLKNETTNASSASIDSSHSASKGKRRNRRPAPPPDLDLGAVKRLCATTEQKIDGFTDAEMKEHIAELESTTERTQELLEYWLKRRDGATKEKEAFEGVIENLVRHARRVRK